MVGQWHRLDPGPVLYAVYPSLGGCEAVLHPWNTERGQLNNWLSIFFFSCLLIISEYMVSIVVWLLFFPHSALFYWPLLPPSYRSQNRNRRSCWPSTQQTAKASIRNVPQKTATSPSIRRSLTARDLVVGIRTCNTSICKVAERAL